MPERAEAEKRNGGPRFAPAPIDRERERFVPMLASTPLIAHAPGLIVLAAIWAAYLVHLPDGMLDWGLSGAALAQGHTANIVLSAFAHAGLVHIGFNSLVLVSLSGPLVTWMGRFPRSWLRYFALYAMAGLAGAALYLAVHPHGSVPMVGASGAISGLIGLVARLSDEHDGLVPLASTEMLRRLWHFVKANALLVVVFAVAMILGGGGGGIAWEAHLGGFLAGLVAARLVLVDARV